MSGQQKALWLKEAKGDFVVGPKAIDKPGSGELLVKVEATALNPVDWKLHKYNFGTREYPVVLGSDAAGVVEDIGDGVTGWQKGDRVLVQGTFSSTKLATFQQYLIAPADRAGKIPSNITFEEAASVPLCLMVAAIIYNSGAAGLSLTEPWTAEGKDKYAGKPFLVYGASTSIGQYVLQLARLSGFSPIIAVASPANFALVKSLGATHTIDRAHVGALAAEVAAITKAPLEHAYDTWSDAASQQAVYDALAPGGRLALVLPPQIAEADGKNVTIVSVLGSVHRPENHKLAVSLFGALERLLRDGLIKPNAVEVLPGGLGGIPEGLARLAADKVSGKKLVAKPQETA